MDSRDRQNWAARPGGTQERLLRAIEGYCAARGWSERQFGREAAGHHAAVARLRRGQGSLRVIARVERFMAENPAEEAPATPAAAE